MSLTVKEDALCIFNALGVNKNVNDYGTTRICRQLTMLKEAIDFAKAELYIATRVGLDNIVRRAKNLVEFLDPFLNSVIRMLPRLSSINTLTHAQLLILYLCHYLILIL